MTNIKDLLKLFLSPNFEFDRIGLLILGAVGVLVILVIARLIKYYYPKLGYGILSLSLWAGIISTAFFFDYFQISYKLYWLALLSSGIIFAAYTSLSYKIKPVTFIKDFISSGALKLLLLWLVAAAIILIPTTLILQNEAYIPAPGVTNDSIMHGILAEGHQANREIELDPYYIVEYPRGFHSFIFFISELTNIAPYMLLFTLAIAAYSFIIFFSYEVVGYLKIKNWSKYLIYLLPTVPYLILITLHGLYLAQIVVIPILVMAVFETYRFKAHQFYRIPFILLLYIAVMNMYGIYAFSCILATIGIRFLISLLDLKKDIVIRYKNIVLNYINCLKTNFIKVLGTLVPILIISLPSLYLLYQNTVSSFRNSTLTFAQGTKFLSPFHTTGVWFDEYFRDGPAQLGIYALVLVLGVQLFFIFKAQIKKELLLTVGTLGLLTLAGVFIFKGDYIQYKYYTFFVPTFLLLFGISVYLFLQKFKYGNLLTAILLTIFIVGAIVLPLNSYKLYKPRGEEYFFTYELMQKEYFDKHSVLALTWDAWPQYFKDSTDDYVPLFGWYYPKYMDQKVDYIILETQAITEPDRDLARIYNEYLKLHPQISEEVSSAPENCISILSEYQIYNLNCY